MSSAQENTPPIELSESDLHFRQAQRSFQSADYPSALRSINRAIATVESEVPAVYQAFRANVRLMVRDFAAAEQDATSAIHAGMDDGRTLAIRATARMNQNRWALALEDLAQAIDQENRNRDQYVRMAEDFLAKGSEFFRQQIVEGNVSADLFYERGLVYYHAGRREKAQRDFELALEKDRDHDLAKLGLARLALDDGELEAVIRSVTPLVKKPNPVGDEALLLRAQAHLRLGDRYQVVRDLNRLRKRVGREPRKLISIAGLSVNIGDPVRAIAEMTHLLKKRPVETEAYRVRGDGYREIKNYAAAIQDYNRYLRRRPDHLTIRVRRGECYLASGEIESALEDFDRVLASEPDNVSAIVGRARVFVARDDLADALNECQRAAALDNQVEEVHATAGDIYFRLCEYSRAIDEYVRAQRLANRDDRIAHYYFLRGTALAQLNQWNESLRCFRKAARRDPHHAGAHVWMASVYARREEWQPALEALERAMQSRPAIAEKYWDLGRPVAEAAIAWFDKMERRNDHSVHLHRSRGLASHFLRDPQRAVGDFDRALQEDDDSGTRIRRGRCLAELGEHDKAIRDFTKVIRKQDSWGPEARFWRAHSLDAVGNLQHALTDMIKAIRAEPDDPRFYMQYGDLLLKKKWGKRAIRAFDRAIQFDPLDPDAYLRRGRAYLRLGNAWRAIGDLTRAIELAPHHAEWWVLRGRAHLKSGHPEQALDDFDQAIARDSHCLPAFIGRGDVMAGQDADAALIWMTKAIQRFSRPSERAQLLFHRGKIFYEMGRAERAVNDFGGAIKRLRDDVRFVSRVRMARARAYAWLDQKDKAIRDLRKILLVQPTVSAVRDALGWLTGIQDSADRPTLLRPPGSPRKPRRPTVVRHPRTINTQWNGELESPLDMLIVKTPDKREYGPVDPPTLLKWAAEGRLSGRTQVLRADWTQWKRIDRLIPELALRDGEVDEFPGIDLHSHAEPPRNETSD